MTYPWEKPVLAVVEPAQAPATQPIEATVLALQRDLVYMVTHTAVRVHSNHSGLQVTVNTPRGQIIPRGECKFTDGTTMEFQDVGMPQVGVDTMTVSDLVACVWDIVRELGLELQP